MHHVMTRADPSMACFPAPRTPITRARSRATDGFSAMTSCTTAPAYRFSAGRRAKFRVGLSKHLAALRGGQKVRLPDDRLGQQRLVEPSRSEVDLAVGWPA